MCFHNFCKGKKTINDEVNASGYRGQLWCFRGTYPLVNVVIEVIGDHLKGSLKEESASDDGQCEGWRPFEKGIVQETADTSHFWSGTRKSVANFCEEWRPNSRLTNLTTSKQKVGVSYLMKCKWLEQNPNLKFNLLIYLRNEFRFEMCPAENKNRSSVHW